MLLTEKLPLKADREGDRYTQQTQSSILPALTSEIIEKYVKSIKDSNSRTVKNLIVRQKLILINL